MSAPLRVAHVITKLAVGGAQETALSIVAGLPPDRFDPWLVSGVEVDQEGTLLDDAGRLGVRVELEPLLIRAVRPHVDVRAVHRLYRHFRAERPDIVHTHSSKAGLIGRTAARLAGVPVVVHSVHGWSFHERQGRAARAAAAGLERAAASVTDALVVVAESDERKGLTHRIGAPPKYVLIRNGLDLDAFSPPGDGASVRAELAVPADAWHVGTVGRVADQKDPLAMVRALAEVAAVCPDVWFTWVGDGPLRAEAQALAASLGFGDRIRFVGVRRDIAAFLASLDAFALSSLWEGLPRTVTEAMAAGVAVVATDVDGVGDVIDHERSGLLTAPAEPTQLARAIRRLHDDPDLGGRLARAGLARANAFGRSEMLRRFVNLYDGLHAGAPAHHAVLGAGASASGS